MAQKFERIEKKFLLNTEQHQTVLPCILDNMQSDEFGKTALTSIYFDDPFFSVIQRSIEKPLYKEKLRVRFYGGNIQTSKIFVELKKKFDGVVYKRRVSIPFDVCEMFLSGTTLSKACAIHGFTKKSQVVAEIDNFMLTHNNLRPSMVIRCNRQAYYPMENNSKTAHLKDKSSTEDNALAQIQDSGLRITFDSNLCFKLYTGVNNLNDTSGLLPIVDKNMIVMEVKSHGSIPVWIASFLSKNKIYPAGFSKYGKAYFEINNCGWKHPYPKKSTVNVV